MPNQPESVLAPHLDEGEQLLWCGQPRQGLRLRGQDALLIPFSLMWGGFAIFGECLALAGAARGPGPVLIMPLFGLPFVAVGLYLIFGRFFADAHIRSKTGYGLTTERIIIVRGFWTSQVKSLPLETLTDITLSQRSDGSGTITFGAVPFGYGLFAGGGWPGAGRFMPPSFEMIERAREVYDMIRSAQKAAKGTY